MQVDDGVFRKMLSKALADTVIYMAAVALLAVLCVQVIAPFISLILWALILAITLYPLHQRLARWIGGRKGLAAVVLVGAGLLLIGVPTVKLGGSFANRVHTVYTDFTNSTITVKPPNPAVADWPLVGRRVYSAWSAAADNLPGFLQANEPQLKNLAKRAVSAAANTASTLLLFFGALVIAGILMAYGTSGGEAMQRIFQRLAGPARGKRLQTLCTATIRSVASGVIGIAFIQALLLGIGFLWAGIPGAGLLALLVLILGILQLPALVVTLPAIAYLWWAGGSSTTLNVVYTVYLILSGMADNVLKPMLLGRGVEAPMPVILIGALGGMATGGIIGLFVGAVVLAVGYQLFMDWIDHREDPFPADASTMGSADPDPD
jgi:predicted PurR-regulated permease PerM